MSEDKIPELTKNRLTEKSDLLYNVRDCKADAFAESKRKEVKTDEKNVQSTAGAGDSPDSGLRYSAADCFCGRAYRRRRHCAQLRDALGDPQIKVTNLTDSFVVQEGAAGTNAGIFELDRAGVLLNGNGHTITVAGQGARAGHLLNITADRVQINDLIEESSPEESPLEPLPETPPAGRPNPDTGVWRA